MSLLFALLSEQKAEDWVLQYLHDFIHPLPAISSMLPMVSLLMVLVPLGEGSVFEIDLDLCTENQKLGM